MTAIEFNTQVSFLSNKLRYFALKLTADMEDANDLLQDTIVKALTYREKFTDSTNLSAWMHTIMKNTFINNYRRQQRSGELFDNTKDLFFLNMPQDSGFTSPTSRLAEKEIHAGINKLEEQYRVPFMMHVIVSDLGVLRGTLSVEAPTALEAYRLLQAQKPILMEYFKDYRNN